jgi:hypothetical protein
MKRLNRILSNLYKRNQKTKEQLLHLFLLKSKHKLIDSLYFKKNIKVLYKIKKP